MGKGKEGSTVSDLLIRQGLKMDSEYHRAGASRSLSRSRDGRMVRLQKGAIMTIGRAKKTHIRQSGGPTMASEKPPM